MTQEDLSRAPSVRVIVVANEKGGSGKSTVAIQIAIALLKAGQSVATIDLDCRQRSFTRYIENRLAWARHRGRELPVPTHVGLEEPDIASPEDEAAVRAQFAGTIAQLAENHGAIVIDTACQSTFLTRLAHATADTLVTPLNDSFVDLDVLGSVDPETFAVTGISHYARLVAEARRARAREGMVDTDWIVLRNRLSHHNTRNKRFVGAAIRDLSQRLGFRCVEGLAERVIFREFYPRGLTAVDDIDEITLGSRPTLSHASAQMEVQALIAALLAPATRSAEPIASAA